MNTKLIDPALFFLITSYLTTPRGSVKKLPYGPCAIVALKKRDFGLSCLGEHFRFVFDFCLIVLQFAQMVLLVSCELTINIKI